MRQPGTHAPRRNLVNVMKELKEAALTRPQAFYEFGVLGEPAVVFPFVMMLHTLKEDFKDDLDHVNRLGA